MDKADGEGAGQEPASDQTDDGPKSGEEALEGGEDAEGAEGDKGEEEEEDAMGAPENHATFQQ